MKTFIRVWKSFAELLGRVNTSVLLTLLYLLVLTPVGLLYRMKKNSVLAKGVGTSWIERTSGDDLERQF